MVRELKELVGEPPHDCKALIKQRNCLAELDGNIDLGGICKMLCIFISVPEYSLLDLFRVYRVLEFSIDAMWIEVTSINLLEPVPESKCQHSSYSAVRTIAPPLRSVPSTSMH
jgi:hypothetical protein